MKPHLKCIRGLWFCSIKPRIGHGTGYTPLQAYDAWLELMLRQEEQGSA